MAVLKSNIWKDRLLVLLLLLAASLLAYPGHWWKKGLSDTSGQDPASLPGDTFQSKRRVPPEYYASPGEPSE
ncbi:MAG: hypothetical protein KDK25_14790 [Leptospiraceae bacterium]|nr:hypothetical protein [Leptospiraceae bacterium]MCB1171611.1 hypothetical protein [Leptospiraceae bacterium]